MVEPYRAYGAAADLFRCTDPEVLIEGPAGTGKSMACLALIDYRAQTFPKSRYLLMRKTRARMGQSVLVTLEDKVLPPGHPILTNVSRMHRESYLYPNGSELVIGGMDDATRIMSTDFDMVVAFEATEFTIDDWERALSRLRNNCIPHPDRPGKFLNQAVADCNPGPAFHWLNQRAHAGKMTRLLSRHADNPTVTPEYLETLSNLTGARRARLFEGLWVSAAGQIYENFNQDVHVIDRELRSESGHWSLWQGDHKVVDLNYFVASVDWGFKAPGSLLVAGIDAEKNAYIVREVYRVQRDLEWWANTAEYMRVKYDIQRFVCDPSRPENIARFNTRLGRAGGYHLTDEADIAGGANNAIQVGLSVVRERWANKSLFILRNALDRPDPILAEQKKPTGLIEEIPSYIYRDHKDGQAIREEPAPDADDHSADALRYLCLFLDSNDWRSPVAKGLEYASGTFGSVMGHVEVLEEDGDRHMWWEEDAEQKDAEDKAVGGALEQMW